MSVRTPPSGLSEHDLPRAKHLLMLEFGSREQFDDPHLEYRRLFSEILGTFMLVLVAAGGGILHGKGQISLAAAVVAPGLMVMAIILFMGAVSGAHLNPAVSLAFASRGDFPWRRVPGYISPAARSHVACLFLLAVFGNVQHPGATLPGPGYPRLAGAADRDRHHGRAGQRDPRHRLGGSERGHPGRAGRRGVHRPGWAVGGTGQRRVDEPGALVRPGAGQRRLDRLLGVRRRAADRRRDRRGCAIILRGRGGDPISHAAGSGVLTPGRRGEADKLSDEIASAT